MHSLAQALTLTLTHNHLANKPQRTAGTLFGLMYAAQNILTSARAEARARRITYEYSIRWRNRNVDRRELSFYRLQMEEVG